MAWEVEYTDEFEEWWETLGEEEQIEIDAVVGLLENLGHAVPYPYSSGVKSSKHGNMRELRIQHKGEPYRVLYAFDPRRTAILLIGGKKGGDARWYRKYVSRADKISVKGRLQNTLQFLRLCKAGKRINQFWRYFLRDSGTALHYVLQTPAVAL